MKMVVAPLILYLLTLSLAACANGEPKASSAMQLEPVALSVPEETATSQTSSSQTDSSEAEQPNGSESRLITVRFAEEKAVVYELNDSPAASSLLEQLPLTIEVENYSTNEKIFYPPRELDTDNTPTASGGAGTLAYYAPWGDVVMFYGDYNENPSLFELGRIVSGRELVAQMSGTSTIDRTE